MSTLRRFRRDVTAADDGVTSVVVELVDEFSGIAAPTVVADVVAAARRDLDSEVPTAAMAEFLHRLARQRLLTVYPVSSAARSA